ncbi:MAG: hypothetical protein JWM95_3249 [Gemmatimonadetes bacterium]|nr:hypothetical protein [Gemmatimonadota bacterium]
MGAMKMDSARAPAAHVMLQAIPLVTRASPSAGGTTETQVALTQALAMIRAGFWSTHGELESALNGEGLTMPSGELNTGASGEGYVDKRHPHTYVHELMVTLRGASGPLAYSVTGGRGFAPFGTDDPMMRPMVKFPINHHLAQILERGALIGAVRLGPAIVEGGTFGGDEPTSPSSLPSLRRLGDSWAIRSTVLPWHGIELQGSYARVASPEQVDGFGLDQRKQSYSARAISVDGGRYLLGEWARTVERDHTRELSVFGYESALVEGAARAGPVGLAVRLEQTERPEEERLADAFRTPRPGSDLSINGITRWRVATLQIDAPSVTSGTVLGVPFIEIARLAASPRDSRSLVTPERLYGTSRFWMLTAGVRLRAGGAHARMGRYGVALEGGPAIATLAGGASPAHTH